MRKGVRKPLRKNICHKTIHLHLSRDHHPEIALVAVRTVVHRLLDLLSGAKERKYLARTRSADAGAVEVLAETTSENDPASTRYRAGIRDDIRKDGRSIAVTEFTSSILAPTSRSWHRSRQDLRGSRFVESIFKEPVAAGMLITSCMLPRNASSTCYVTYGRLILALLQQVRSARLYGVLFPRT